MSAMRACSCEAPLLEHMHVHRHACTPAVMPHHMDGVPPRVAANRCQHTGSAWCQDYLARAKRRFRTLTTDYREASGARRLAGMLRGSWFAAPVGHAGYGMPR